MGQVKGRGGISITFADRPGDSGQLEIAQILRENRIQGREGWLGNGRRGRRKKSREGQNQNYRKGPFRKEFHSFFLP
jgi:hypothetical protein